MPNSTSPFLVIAGIALGAFGLFFFGWVFFRLLKRSDSPAALILKWLVTLFIFGWLAWVVEPWSDAPMVWADVIAVLFGGVCLTVIWREHIASIVAKPFTALYDGGDTEIEPRPYYSIAEAKRKRGQYTEAVAEVRKQLQKFPTDFEGQLKLAEIQVENLNDLPGAELTIRRLCEQPGHPPRNIAFALNSLADWHIKFGVDREAAQQDLENLIAMLPESEFALAAAQRIGHLAKTETLLASHDRQRIHVPEGVKNVGLLHSSAHLRPTSTDPAQLAEEYVKHLEQHPQDTEAREKLAAIYADHYGRLDLAADQLDQLINQPNQPPRNVVHWLNLLADLQIRHGADYDIIRETLEQIIKRYPNLAAAGMARNRIDLIKLELKAKQRSEPVKLGNYEQNIGLNRGSAQRLPGASS
jgi:tetratricopeptide (TPR) repeat protein